MALVTYFGGHWNLVIAAVLAVLLSGGAAFFFRSWQFALVAIAIAVAGFLYQGAVTDGIALQMAKDADSRAQMLQSHIDVMNAANEADVKRAVEDQNTIEQLQEQVRATPKNDSSCLDVDSARRLQNIR